MRCDNGHVCRDTGDPKAGHLSVLPHHHPDYNKYYLETTHNADFKPPYHFVPEPVSCTWSQVRAHASVGAKPSGEQMT